MLINCKIDNKIQSITVDYDDDYKLKRKRNISKQYFYFFDSYILVL